MRLLPRDDMHVLSGVYALDALGGAERDRFEHHLARCPSCQVEVRGLQETAARFALAVSAQPPPRMKTRVMAGAARTRQLPPVPDVGPLPARGPGLLRRIAVPAAAACLALAIALAVLLGISRGQLSAERAQQREIAAVLNAPGARIVRGRTTVGGLATAVVAPQLHRLVFTSTGMRSLPGSEVYQLWVIGPAGTTTATSAGLLTQAADGSTVPVLASGLAAGDRIGVTVEPAGGTSKPTTTPVVVIPLPS
jgi:anti-sigma-K factor RskA